MTPPSPPNLPFEPSPPPSLPALPLGSFHLAAAARGDFLSSSEYVVIKLGRLVISSDCGNQPGFTDCSPTFERCVEPTDAHSDAIAAAVAASPSGEVIFEVDAAVYVDSYSPGCTPAAEVKIALQQPDGTVLEQTGSTSVAGARSP